MTSDHSGIDGKPSLKITDIGHSTILIEIAGTRILTDPWFTDPILGIVTHPHGIGMPIEEIPELDLILISHGHFDHCDLKAISRLNKSAVVIVPDEKTAARIRKLGYPDITVLIPWESRLVSQILVTALPADHVVPECSYVISYDKFGVYFGGDTRYVNEVKEIGEKYELTVALLPVNGLRFPFIGKVVMDPAEAAEAAVNLKAGVSIPIHHNISLSIPFLKKLFDCRAIGTPEQFAAELALRNKHMEAVMLKPGESWESG